MKLNFEKILKKMKIRPEVLNEIEFILYEGGEIPEVCFWNSYFYLTSPPPQGLGLHLSEEEIKALKLAVLNRYLLLIKRDLTYEFIDKPFYRGLGRAIVNLRRLKKFIENSDLTPEIKPTILKKKIKNMFKEFKTKLKQNGENFLLVETNDEINEFKKELMRL